MILCGESEMIQRKEAPGETASDDSQDVGCGTSAPSSKF